MSSDLQVLSNWLQYLKTSSTEQLKRIEIHRSIELRFLSSNEYIFIKRCKNLSELFVQIEPDVWNDVQYIDIDYYRSTDKLLSLQIVDCVQTKTKVN